MADADFLYSDLLPTGPDETPYRLVTTEGVSTSEVVLPDGSTRTFLHVEPEALRRLTAEAMHDISHYLRPAHLAQLRKIIDDPEASGNDRFVALDLLKNVNISAGGVLPMCQDTGTAIVMGKKSEGVLTGADDAEAISRGVHDAYTQLNLRYSQLAPLTTYEEKNTGTNLPAQIELYSAPGTKPMPEYSFLFMAKGGGSANKSFLYQETKAILNPTRLLEFLDEKIKSLGTAACPPYHLAVVIGGTSAEFALKTAKYASAHYLDELPTEGSMSAHGFRDVELEQQVFELTQSFGIGAQFGGKYFCHDVRVVRLPRHGASCPVAIAVSCSADRQARAKITPEGVFLEQLETDPAQYMPDAGTAEDISGGEVVQVDLTRPMDEIRAQLSQYPVKTRLSLTGPLVVARDIAHAKIAERLEAGEPMPQYLKDHPVYYAGPAKTPEGMASGSFGPTTAGRMDSYVRRFQEAGGSLVMLAKGNRSKQVTEACDAYGGFYLGSIGGPAARLAQDCIRSQEVIEYPELGMEAVWRIEVEDFPAFIVVDDKGNDFFTDPSGTVTVPVTGLRVRSAQ
ncbi:fumarate hydratase [Aeromicrobium sp. CnD17-E]|uniref:fumarate hydratase n=1 Tax=Aeromicrobium sp. CnD17-E TaxID=2954487 RepID=UPI0020978C9A|nr:fumarate hydratase [Aeromicrobium sp. CnD17-E]MCO7238944.1 fumarate hydratase [Aeromicrobium sp. CnD17-E]